MITTTDSNTLLISLARALARVERATSAGRPFPRPTKGMLRQEQSKARDFASTWVRITGTDPSQDPAAQRMLHGARHYVYRSASFRQRMVCQEVYGDVVVGPRVDVVSRRSAVA